MGLPRLIIPLSVQFGVRYLLRTGLLERLRDHAQPLIVLAWDDPELAAELRALGAEIYRLPQARLSDGYRRLRQQINVAYFRRLASPSTAIDRHRRQLDYGPLDRLKENARDALYTAALALPGRAARLERRECEQLAGETNVSEFRALLAEARADAAIGLTPFMQDEEFLLRAAQLDGLPLGLAMLSFDNLTTRHWIPLVFERYLLWNRYNADELRRGYPAVAGRPVHIAGPPQFDFYYDPAYRWDEADWRRRLGLPPGRPVILFGGGPTIVVPDEPRWLAQLDEAVERGELPGRPVILFRRHPNDPAERWSELRGRTRHVAYDEPWPPGRERILHGNIRREEIEKLVSTLCHSAVHVNTSSTLSVDGAVFDRPQVGPAYDDRPGRRYDRAVRELYLREHYLPITRSGGLAIARSRAELMAAVREGLERPAAGAAGRRLLVSEICTFTDGRCTERVAGHLQAFLAGVR